MYWRNNLAGKKVLDVHFRGQEHKTAIDHPSCPTIPQMLAKVEEFLDRFSIGAIFWVTEEKQYADVFKERFGELVYCTDAYRTYGVNAYHLRPYPRPLHMYKLGLDVLCDALLLGRADYLLASGQGTVANGSNVSLAAQVFSKGYAHAELIYNGINRFTPFNKDGLRHMAVRARNALRILAGKPLG